MKACLPVGVHLNNFFNAVSSSGPIHVALAILSIARSQYFHHLYTVELDNEIDVIDLDNLSFD